VTTCLFRTIGLGAVPFAATSGCHRDLEQLAANAEPWFPLGSSPLLQLAAIPADKPLPAPSLIGGSARHLGGQPVLANPLALFLLETLAPIGGLFLCQRKRRVAAAKTRELSLGRQLFVEATRVTLFAAFIVGRRSGFETERGQEETSGGAVVRQQLLRLGSERRSRNICASRTFQESSEFRLRSRCTFVI